MEKKKLTKKQKGIIGGAVAVIAIAVIAGIVLHNPLKLAKDTVSVEFGEPISTEAKTYLKKDVDKEIVKNTKVTYKANPVEGQTYDKVGEYKVKLTYENKEKEVVVKVEDTTAPTFNATADAGIDTIEGVSLDFATLITATDLSGAEVSFDTNGVDLNKAGSYTLKAVAKDKAGNKAEKDIKVAVAKKPANMSGSEVTVDQKTGKVSVKSKAPTKSYASKGSSSKGNSSGGYKGPSHGNVAGSGHTWEHVGSEDWNPEWD